MSNYLCAVALKYQGKYAQARGYYTMALGFPDCVYRQYAAEQLAKIDEEYKKIHRKRQTDTGDQVFRAAGTYTKSELSCII